MSYPVGYIGPVELWRRFMAGFTVNRFNVLEDDSEWVLRPMPRYHRIRLREMVGDFFVV